MREIRIIILVFFQSSRQVHITGIFFTTWTCCTAKCTCTAYYNWMIKVFSVEFTVITCYKFLNAIHALPCSSCYVLIVLTLSQKICASPHSKPRLSFGGSACRVYTIGARKTRQTRTLLEKFWRISLYVTDDAIAKRSATLIFVK